jgi:hypothetical protein
MSEVKRSKRKYRKYKMSKIFLIRIIDVTGQFHVDDYLTKIEERENNSSYDLLRCRRIVNGIV